MIICLGPLPKHVIPLGELWEVLFIASEICLLCDGAYIKSNGVTAAIAALQRCSIPMSTMLLSGICPFTCHRGIYCSSCLEESARGTMLHPKFSTFMATATSQNLYSFSSSSKRDLVGYVNCRCMSKAETSPCSGRSIFLFRTARMLRDERESGIVA